VEKFISIRAGKVENPQGLRKAIAELPDGRYLCTIVKKNKRTGQQNRYLHGVLFPELAKALVEAGYEGITAEMAKEVAKDKFLKISLPNFKAGTGEYIEYTKHTSELTTIEMNEFIDSVIRFAAECLNYQIMYPSEQSKINY
jgi:hypothetical protein